MSASLEPRPHPIRDGAARQRDVFVGDGGKATDLAVRRRAVTVYTPQPAIVLQVAAAYVLQPDIMNDVVMAPDAVLLHDAHPRLANPDDLRFEPQGENRGVIEPVRRLEKVMAEDIVLRHVAVVAGSHLAMGTLGPGGILRPHHMAVDARLRRIRQVRRCTRDVKKNADQPNKDSHHHNDGNLPLGRRRKGTKETPKSAGFGFRHVVEVASWGAYGSLRTAATAVKRQHADSEDPTTIFPEQDRLAIQSWLC